MILNSSILLIAQYSLVTFEVFSIQKSSVVMLYHKQVENCCDETLWNITTVLRQLETTDNSKEESMSLLELILGRINYQ